MPLVSPSQPEEPQVMGPGEGADSSLGEGDTSPGAHGLCVTVGAVEPATVHADQVRHQPETTQGAALSISIPVPTLVHPRPAARGD